MKKSLKIASAALAAIMCAAGAFGCGGKTDSDIKNERIEKPVSAPNYENSDKTLNMYAYICPTNGEYTLENGVKVTTESYKTEERFKEYKECGFDTLLCLGNGDAWTGSGTWESSAAKLNLDLCEKVGLKCIVLDHRIYDLSVSDTSLIGKDKKFATEEELVAKLTEYMQPYINHPAFYGLEFIDEPYYYCFPAIGELYSALRKIKADIYINCVMLPYTEGADGKYTDNPTIHGKVAYRDYVKSFLADTNAGYFDYDDYPFLFANGKRNIAEFKTSYLSNLQIAAQEAVKQNADVYLTLQSYASTTNSGYRKRDMTAAEFNYQLHAGFAFGVKDFRYYTYWQFPNEAGDPSVSAIMSHNGEKQYYEIVKEVNAAAKKQAKILLNYEYVSTIALGDDNDYPTHFAGIKSVQESEFGAKVTATRGTVFNRLYDAEKGIYGYYVFNGEDPADKFSTEAVLEFSDALYVAVYIGGEAEYYKLSGGRLKLELGAGEGAFVIPFN